MLLTETTKELRKHITGHTLLLLLDNIVWVHGMQGMSCVHLEKSRARKRLVQGKKGPGCSKWMRVRIIFWLFWKSGDDFWLKARSAKIFNMNSHEKPYKGTFQWILQRNWTHLPSPSSFSISLLPTIHLPSPYLFSKMFSPHSAAV